MTRILITYSSRRGQIHYVEECWLNYGYAPGSTISPHDYWRVVDEPTTIILKAHAIVEDAPVLKGLPLETIRDCLDHGWGKSNWAFGGICSDDLRKVMETMK